MMRCAKQAPFLFRHHPASRRLLRIIASLALLLWFASLPGLANAQDLQVGLHIQSERLQLAYNQSVRQTDINRLDLVWHETLTPWLDGSIRLGKFWQTQDSNPIPAGQATVGTALGLGLQFFLYRGSRLQLSTALGYQYMDSSASLNSQTVETSWHQFTGQLAANIRLLGYTYLSLGVGVLSIDGQERASGTVSAVSSFHSNTSGFARLGVLIGLDRNSHIDLDIETGSVSGARIAFQRWF